MAPKYDIKDKKYAMRQHSINRLKYRYKIKDANEEMYHKLCKYIKESRGKSTIFDDGTITKFIDKQSVSRSVWRIKWDNKEFLACYDRTRKLINTFLDPSVKDEEIQYKKWLMELEDEI